MFTGILGLLLIAAAIGLLVKGKIQTAAEVPPTRGYGGLERGTPAKYLNLRKWALIPLGLGILFVLFSVVYKLDVGEAAVIKPISGNVTKEDTDVTAGFGVKAPWESVIKFNIRNQTISFYGTEGGAEFSDDEIKDIRITGSSADNAAVYLDETIQYSISPDKVFEIYRDYRTAERLKTLKILPGIRAAVQVPPTQYATSDIKLQRPALAADTKKIIETNLAEAGVTVESVELRAISFEDAVQKSLDAVQTRKAQTEAARESLNTAGLEAEKVRVSAQAQADADQITRCGATTTQVDVTVNGKLTKQTQVKPIPIQSCQNRLNEQVLTNKYIDMLTAAAEKGNTIYVVPPGGSNLLQLTPQQTK